MEIAQQNMTEDHNITRESHVFGFVESRYDEPLTEAYNLRRHPQLVVIDPSDGNAYYWDQYEYANNETLKNWLLNKEYLKTSHSIPAPQALRPDQFTQHYIIKWFRSNFGQRFCWWVYKVPGLKYPTCMFCDCNMNDIFRFKEDRFTIIFAPLAFIFFGIPYGWKAAKLLWAGLMWCCTVNVYVEEEEEDKKKK